MDQTLCGHRSLTSCAGSAKARLVPDTSVLRTLEFLAGAGLRIGVLNDASAEIAATWPASPNRSGAVPDTVGRSMGGHEGAAGGDRTG